MFYLELEMDVGYYCSTWVNLTIIVEHLINLKKLNSTFFFKKILYSTKVEILISKSIDVKN